MDDFLNQELNSDNTLKPSVIKEEDNIDNDLIDFTNKSVISVIEFSNSDDEEYITESSQLSSGIFWVITGSYDIEDYTLLIFDIPCDVYGNATDAPKIQPNAKKGLTYNHKKLWEEEIKGNSVHRPYNKKTYNHYPRGRVEISNNKATIFLNPHINTPNVINEIKQKFGLIKRNISEIQISEDHSNHYQCFIDREE